MFKGILGWLGKTSVQSVLLVFLAIGLIVLGMWMADSSGETRANDWLGRLEIFKPIPVANFADQSKLASEIKERLLEQLNETRNREAYHADVMRYFYTRYYMSITMFTVLGAISAILLVVHHRFCKFAELVAG
jgi:hypothetical protein